MLLLGYWWFVKINEIGKMYTWILVFFTLFLKNRNISSKIKRSKVTDYAALMPPTKIAVILKKYCCQS